MNNGMIHQLAEQFARRVQREAGADPGRQIEWAYAAALSRPPTDEERGIARAELKKLTGQWTKHLAGTGKPDKEQAAIQALATLCHAILNSAEFLYVD